MTLPRVLKLFDSVGRKDYIEIEWSVLELNKVFTARNLGCLRIRERKTEVTQAGDESLAVLRCLLDEEIGILGSIRKSEEDRPGFANEEIANAMGRESISNLQGLPVFKRAHSQASREDSLRTSSDTLPSC